MTIAGLWTEWKDKATGEALKFCTMVITEPNKFAAEVHGRMPVILEPQDFQQWEKGNVKDAAAFDEARRRRFAYDVAGVEEGEQF